jgi:hypothetical protein
MVRGCIPTMREPEGLDMARMAPCGIDAILGCDIGRDPLYIPRDGDAD